LKKEALAVVSISILLFTVVVGFFFVNLASAQTSETIIINADGSIDPATALISTFDRVTYTFTGDIYAEIVVERNNIIIDGNEFFLQGNGNGRGIALYGRTNVTVRNTQIKNFACGIFLDSSSGNSLNGNKIINNGYGVWLGSSSSNKISSNNITANNATGVQLALSSSNVIDGNNISASDYGVWFDSSSSNNIFGNNVTSNE
jgi:parallel beta-helix repeat protein